MPEAQPQPSEAAAASLKRAREHGEEDGLVGGSTGLEEEPGKRQREAGPERGASS